MVLSWGRFEVEGGGSVARTETVGAAQLRHVRRTVGEVRKREVVEVGWWRIEVKSGGDDARTETVRTTLFRHVRRTVVGVSG